ncbi:hypothetical protein, partial [Sodalis sp.]|uniref:hypothetical protein n=1 Tax=Sodalis sp. (in: enterobacteria) TaxID=1898979 RepID=UPI003872F447
FKGFAKNAIYTDYFTASGLSSPVGCLSGDPRAPIFPARLRGGFFYAQRKASKTRLCVFDVDDLWMTIEINPFISISYSLYKPRPGGVYHDMIT